MTVGGARVLALIPARSGSKGLPGKNTKTLVGRPLIAYSIDHALASEFVDDVVVTTDDEAIADVARSAGADVPFLRPAELATDEAATYAVVLHALRTLADQGRTYDLVVVLEPTSPLRRPASIDRGLLTLQESDSQALVSVVSVGSSHPDVLVSLSSGSLIRPATGGHPNGVRRQDQTELYYPDGSVYIAKVATMSERAGFYGDDTIGLVVSKMESFEIDDLEDFELVEAILAGRQE